MKSIIGFSCEGFIQALLLTTFFHEGLSFMAIVHNQTCISTLAPCSWGFIWGAVNVSGSFGYFTDPRFLNSLSMHHLVNQSFPFLEIFLPSLDSHGDSVSPQPHTKWQHIIANHVNILQIFFLTSGTCNFLLTQMLQKSN